MAMRLERVELVGFKSFCDRQEVSFRGGVTGIVGPNGCGKSNISDAISWVLGEQSAKSLRGASMEDVIFAGSQARQPVGLAEVNLKVSGLNGNSPDGSPECIVTRRLYRNGESEYLMNGQVCRLRDVHELFMDTGLGSKAYSIIEQGKIGQILSTKPADRRALIEEAAGITKYRARRRQTALKLEAAQQNLLRVNDIINEVEKQLESLKRQASKARRYHAQREEMRGLERILFGRRYRELEDRLRLTAGQIAEENEREQTAAVVVQSEEAQLEVRRNSLYEEEVQLEQGRARLSELTLAVDRQQARAGFCKEQITEAATRAAEARTEAAALDSRLAPFAEVLSQLDNEGQRLSSELREVDEAASAGEALVAESVARQNATEADLDVGRERQVTLMSRIAALGNARESARSGSDRAAGDLLRLGTESEELERERVRVVNQRQAAEKRQADAKSLLADLAADRATALARAAEAHQRAALLAHEADALQSERDSLAGRRASLEEMVATHSAFDEGVRALLGRPEGIEVLGVVADYLETDSTHERAVESFLGDRLQAILTPDSDHALRGIRYLEQASAGRGSFLPLASARTKNGCEILREVKALETSVRGLLSDHYRVTGAHADAIRAALPDALVVDTLEEAFALLARRGPVPCVTLSGETVRGSLIEGGRGVKGLLAPKREVREVASRAEQIETEWQTARERQHLQLEAEETAAAEARRIEERIHSAEKDLVAIQHDLGVAAEEGARLDRKQNVLSIERQQAEQEREEALTRLAEIEAALETAQADCDRSAETVSSLAAAVAQLRAATEGAQQRASETRARLAALRERITAHAAEKRRQHEQEDELKSRSASALERAEEADRRRAELDTEVSEAERLLADSLVERDRMLGDVARVEDRVRDLRNELEGREAALKERRRAHSALRDALAELDVTQARTGSDLDHLTRECLQTLSQSAAQAAATLSDEDQNRDLDALTQEVQEIRDRLERMGPVNILAVEQLQEYEERYQFLTTQRQDLLDSIADLDQSIKKIDRTSRERFQEAFQTINQHFGEVFRQLFGGGTAGLSLIDEEDVLESGIDIMAQPPGKRLQSVLLLSGGEKALTAISLLFAIFQYKPSPFCILDEVDAPLDDANIGRFVKMLEGLKDQTQFVLITHSRRTMEIADQLYGVTMEEPGVSKLVSVRLT